MRGESHRLRIGSRGTTLVGLTLGALIVGLVLLQRSFASAGGAQRHTKIVFDRFIGPGPTIDYDVFVMNPDGSHRQRLTQNPAYDWAPAVSPNGRRIVFGSDRDGDDEIFKMRADGSRQHKLTRNNDADSEPAYSPERQADRLRKRPGRRLRDLQDARRRLTSAQAHPQQRRRRVPQMGSSAQISRAAAGVRTPARTWRPRSSCPHSPVTARIATCRAPVRAGISRLAPLLSYRPVPTRYAPLGCSLGCKSSLSHGA
jgi:hypothetical protein